MQVSATIALDDGRGDGRRAGLAGLVAKQAVDALLGEALLPAPDRRAADAGAPRHFEHRQSLAGKQNDLGALHMFEGAAAITGDLLEAPIHVKGRKQSGPCGKRRDLCVPRRHQEARWRPSQRRAVETRPRRAS